MNYRYLLVGGLLLLLLGALPGFAAAVEETLADEEIPAEEMTPNLTEEDRQVVEMLDLLEILELLNEIDNVAALEENP